MKPVGVDLRVLGLIQDLSSAVMGLHLDPPRLLYLDMEFRCISCIRHDDCVHVTSFKLSELESLNSTLGDEELQKSCRRNERGTKR